MKFFLLLLAIVAFPSYAQWSQDPKVNTRVTNGGLLPQIISDGNGGTYIVFQDSPALLRQLWVQRLDRYGYVRFPNNGIRVSSADRNQTPYSFLLSDGVGGVIVVFTDFHVIGNETFGAVYAQRIDSSGAKLWGEAGIEVSPLADNKAPVSACSDGESGIFVFWGEDTGNHRVFELWGQRVNARGQLAWPGRGILITDEFTSFNVATPNPAVSDGKKGAIVLYSDSTGTRLQRINAPGNFLWQDGINIFQVGRQMIEDGQGGIIVTGVRFVLDNSGYHFAVGALRINSSGQMLWGPRGISIADTVTDNTNLYLSKDYAGGAVFGLLIFDIRNANRKWISKRISESGNVLWDNHETGGEVITGLKGNSIFKTFTQVSSSKFDFFVQRLDADGHPVWNSPVLFSKTAGSTMIEDSQDGVIIIWTEIGANSRFGIFAQQVSRNGKLGEVLTTSISEPERWTAPKEYSLYQSYPNPFKSVMIIKYELPKDTFVQLRILDLNGKEVMELLNKEERLGIHQVVWNGKDKKGGNVPSGVYLYQLRVAGNMVKTRKAVFIK